MRRILFRGKRVDNGKWVYGDLIKTKHGVYIINTSFMPAATIPVSLFTEVLPETVGQYTGLKDKNGKEGYCKDIWKCQITKSLFVIEWSNGKAKFELIPVSLPKNHHYIRELYELNEGEIIGNEFENPELLK